MNTIPAKPGTDPEQIRAAYAAVTRRSTSKVVEVRALHAWQRGAYKPQVLAGYFDNPQDIAKAVEPVKARGVYITLNELNPDLLARRANRIAPAEKGFGANDQHVLRRRWLPIDCDPVRLPDISASDAEHALAIERAMAIRDELRRRGWPEPIFADSGNGGHLLYAIDLPSDDGGLVAAVLAQLAEQFNDSQVKIDTVNANPSRIWKLYGTRARKGDDTPERPYRMARILELPDELCVVDETALQAVAQPSGLRAGTATRANGVKHDAQPGGLCYGALGDDGDAQPGGLCYDLPAWIATYFPEADGPQPWKDGGRIWELPVCPYNPDHAGSAFIAQLPGGPIAAGCHHNSCQHWGWAELRTLKEGPRPRSASRAEQLTAEALIAAVEAATRDAPAEARKTAATDAALDLVDRCTHFSRTELLRAESGLQRLGCTKAFCKEWRGAVNQARRTMTGGAAQPRGGAPGGGAPGGGDGPSYQAVDGRMYRVNLVRDSSGEQYAVSDFIADFDARITEELRSGDEVVFHIEGMTAGGEVFGFDIDGQDFGDDGKLKQLLTAHAGAGVVIAPGMARHLGPAIQQLTGPNVTRTTLWRRFGWRFVDGEAPAFITGDTALPGMRILTQERLPYRWNPDADLATGLTGLRHALRSIDPSRTSVLLSSILQGPLGGLVGWRGNRYVTMVTGKTGSMKTSVVRLFMCLFGKDFAEDWALIKLGEGSTRNALLELASFAWDLPFFLDNYKPNTGDGEMGFRNMIHNFTEGGGRERCNERSELKKSKALACWPVITGEDVPLRDAATLARMALVPFPWGHGGNDYHDLTAAQALSHHLPAVGRAWVEWLASTDAAAILADVRERLEAALARWRTRLLELGATVNWQRLAMNLAINEIAWQVACAHPQLGPVLDEFTSEHARGLDQIAVEMARLMKQSSEAETFLETLRQLLAAGEVVLLSKNETPPPGKIVIGTIPKGRGGGAYVFPELARGAVERWLGKGGLNGISSETLFRQLAEMNHLLRRDAGRNTIKTRVNGSLQRVLHLSPEALGWSAEDETEEEGQ